LTNIVFHAILCADYPKHGALGPKQTTVHYMKRILVFDDDPTQHEVVECTLIGEGVDATLIDHAYNRAEALGYLRTATYGVVISDVDAPSADDGFAVMRAAKARGMRVISASGRMSDIRNLVMAKAGPDFCLQKPYELAELLAPLKRLKILPEQKPAHCSP